MRQTPQQTLSKIFSLNSGGCNSVAQRSSKPWSHLKQRKALTKMEWEWLPREKAIETHQGWMKLNRWTDHTHTNAPDFTGWTGKGQNIQLCSGGGWISSVLHLQMRQLFKEPETFVELFVSVNASCPVRKILLLSYGCKVPWEETDTSGCDVFKIHHSKNFINTRGKLLCLVPAALCAKERKKERKRAGTTPTQKQKQLQHLSIKHGLDLLSLVRSFISKVTSGVL